VSFHFVIKELERRQFARMKERKLIAMPQRSCRSTDVPLGGRLAAVLRSRCGHGDDRDPAEGEVKGKGCSSQTERAEGVVGAERKCRSAELRRKCKVNA
jgi:hypothetical protein